MSIDLKNLSQLKSVDLVVMTLHKQYLNEKQLFFMILFSLACNFQALQ